MFFAFFLVLACSALTYTINQLEDQQDQNDYTQNKVPKKSSYYKSNNVKKIYESTLKVFPGAFAFTKAESEQMPDLLLRSVQSDFSCKKKFSKSTLWKIKELNSILNATHCGDIYHSRYRRSEITNNDGSITSTKRCVKRGESLETEDNYAYLAASCSVTTDLSENRCLPFKLVTQLFIFIKISFLAFSFLMYLTLVYFTSGSLAI